MTPSRRRWDRTMLVEGTDWEFWVLYLMAVIPGLVGGWWVRGMVEKDRRERERERWMQDADVWKWEE